MREADGRVVLGDFGTGLELDEPTRRAAASPGPPLSCPRDPRAEARDRAERSLQPRRAVVPPGHRTARCPRALNQRASGCACTGDAPVASRLAPGPAGAAQKNHRPRAGRGSAAPIRERSGHGDGARGLRRHWSSRATAPGGGGSGPDGVGRARRVHAGAARCGSGRDGAGGPAGAAPSAGHGVREQDW